MRLRELKLEEMEQVVGGATEPQPWQWPYWQFPKLPEPWSPRSIIPPPRQPEERE